MQRAKEKKSERTRRRKKDGDGESRRAVTFSFLVDPDSLTILIPRRLSETNIFIWRVEDRDASGERGEEEG